MSKRKQFDAPDIAIGFYHQSLYSLVVLLDAGDDESVSVESTDDIRQDGHGTPSVWQVVMPFLPSANPIV